MRASLVLTLSAMLLAAPAAAQTGYAALAMAPGGDRVAAVETAEGQRGRIVVRMAAGGKVVRTIDPCPQCTYSGLAFGPTGMLAYLARDRTAGTVTLAVDDGTAPRTVATIAGIGSTPRFSPDGGRIAMLVTIGAAKEAGATQPGVRQVGEIGEQNDAQRIAVFDLAGPAVSAEAVKPLSPEGRYVYEYDWTPDGTGFVATTALGNGDANWWVATLDAIDARTGAVRQIARPTTQLDFPRVSPDGRTVAYIGGLMSDFGATGGDVWTVPFAGGMPVNRTPGYKATPTSIDWTAGGLRATVLAGASYQLVALDPDSGRSDVAWSMPGSLSAGDGRAVYSTDGRVMATVAQDFTHAPAIWAGPAGGLRQITHDNDALPPMVRARTIEWQNEGHDVQGWLLAPLGADPTRAALITDVHGGPSSATTPTFVSHGLTADLVKAGYYVFLPNPRGSYGQGEAFTAANRRDFGGGDLRDILAGIDAVKKVAPIDEARLGLTGCSYGGFMAMWANTQTDRFKAIVAGAGITNWVSYYGTNGIDQWMLPFFGKSVYEDYKAYEDVSAVYRMKQAKTPTFLYVGELDIEVPPTQSVEHWKGLRAQGVPASLMVYPGAGHCVTAPEQAADVRKRTLAWFDRYVK